MREEKALNYFNNGYNCSQSVLCAFCEEYGMDLAKASDMAVAFGGGVGRQGQMCGCISGALMVLGLKYGANSTTDNTIKVSNYERTTDFCKRFSEINGGFNCKDIIKYDLSNLEERKKAQDENIFKTKCTVVVSETVKLLDEFLNQ